MTVRQSAHRSPGTPRLLRNAARRTTAQLVGTLIGAMAFVALGATLLLAAEWFVGRTVRLLFIRFTADQTTVVVTGAVTVLFFGFAAALTVWELVRRNT